MVAPCGLVFAGGRNIPAEQFSGDSGAVIALCGKLEDKLHNGSGFRVRLHSAIVAFTVAIRTDFALILTALHLGIFRAFGLDGHIAAVIFADKIFESYIHAAGIALEIVGVKIVADGDKPGMEQRKHTLNEVAGFNAVSSETGEVLDDDTVNSICPHHFDQLLHLGAFKVRAAVTVVDELQDFSVQIFGHCRRIFVENKELVFNAHTIVFIVLNGQADVEGDYIFLHCFNTST